MPLRQQKLLVTTALEETWGSEESLLFLGEWCKLYDRRHVWTARHHGTVRFHWDDREKLKRDYDYLKSLHDSLLHGLASALNALHHVNHSVRYWQILIDPWLMSFVGVVYDRWECLRVAFQEHGELMTIVLEDHARPGPPFSYGDYSAKASHRDEWNHSLYGRIIESEYPDTCEIQRKRGPGGQTAKLQKSASRRPRWRRRIASKVDQIVGFFDFRTDIVFVEAYFGIGSLIRLNLELGQVPRLFRREFDCGEVSAGAPSANTALPDRTGLRLSFQPSSAFEALLVRLIVDDAPVSLVESYPTFRDWARGLSIRPKAIVTANAHWSHAHVKAWMAEQVESGVKLAILEHGGSLPAYREFFDWEEDISDVKGTWFLPYHVKHVQLPPSKFVRAFRRKLEQRVRGGSKAPYCVLIGNEEARYVFRAHFYPMVAQCLTSSDYVARLQRALDQKIKKALRIRPQTDFGWNTRQRYLDMFGPEHLLPPMELDRALAKSRVIVCTYPETTFSEAMATGVPTILMYPDHLYERHPITLPLLDMLRSVKIVFHDPASAAAHVNAIWDDPGQWWGNEDVCHARAEFRRQATLLDGDWLKQWRSFALGLAG